MTPHQHAPVNDTSADTLARLVQGLSDAEAALQEQLSGQVDAVVNEHGRPLLTEAAKKQLIHDDEVQHQAIDTLIAIMDALPGHIALLNPDGIILTADASWRGFTSPDGLQSSSAQVGQNYLAICDHAQGEGADEARAAAAGVRRILKGELPEFSHVYPCQIGDEPRWFHLIVTPLPAGKSPGAVVMHLDITERRKNADHLRLMESCIAHLNDIVIVTEADMLSEPGPRIVFVNEAFERVTGYTGAEVLGRSPRMLQGPKTDRAELERIKVALVTGKPVRSELINYHKSGAEYWIEMDITPVISALGELTHFVAVERDVTERKKLESQLIRAQRMESIGTLAGGIAHDLNNLLSPIIMGVDLMKQLEPRDNVRNIMINMERSARRGADLVKQVLSFARGVEGVRVPIQLNHIAREIESIIENTFPKNITFESQNPKDLWLIVGDPTQLNQVLLNLCVNARDAMPTGGRLTVTLSNVDIDPHFAAMDRVAAPGRYVVIKVADTGCGMPKAIQDRIFDAFFTTKEVGKGTGLGLSTALGIVCSHGGIMNVYSEVGAGSVFKVYLPAPEDVVEPETENITWENLPRGRGELILLVDDEASILSVTKQTLEAFGYRVIVAEDGAQAIGTFALHRDEIALVITDMMMPVMDGPSLIAAIRRINTKMPIIGASGFNSYTNAARVTAAGAHYNLVKPYTAEKLLVLVRAVLAETSGRR